MNTPTDPAPIETHLQYHQYIAELEVLMLADPDPETPEGLRLLALVDAIEVFERKEWPSMFPLLAELPANDEQAGDTPCSP